MGLKEIKQFAQDAGRTKFQSRQMAFNSYILHFTAEGKEKLHQRSQNVPAQEANSVMNSA